MMREKLARFMAGRNGNDQLNLFLFAIDAILLLAAAFVPGAAQRWVYLALLALLGYIYFRMFSRNLTRRREENGRYLRLRYRLSTWVRLRREKWVQRKDYKFFTCPACKTTLRVPRGHGKLKIVCRKCGNTFTGKS